MPQPRPGRVILACRVTCGQYLFTLFAIRGKPEARKRDWKKHAGPKVRFVDTRCPGTVTSEGCMCPPTCISALRTCGTSTMNAQPYYPTRSSHKDGGARCHNPGKTA